MTPQEKSERAKQLLADPLIEAAFGDIRLRLVSRLEQAAISDTDTQHEITLMLQLLKQLRTQLNVYLQDGQIQEHKRKQDTFIQRMKERIA